MEITIKRGAEILAHHTTDSPMSHYGQGIWTVEISNPSPGPAIWQQGDQAVPIEILKMRGGWLLCKAAEDPGIIGILWSDGSYYADYALTASGKLATSAEDVRRIKGTIVIDPSDPDDIGNILF